VVRRGVDALAWVPIVLAVAFSGRDVLAPGPVDRRRSWVLPAVALVTIILIYPMLDCCGVAHRRDGGRQPLSLHLREPIAPCSPTGSFYGMVGVTAIFVAGSVVLQLAIGFALAWLIDAGRRRRVPGTLVARMAVVSAG
jgi:ABC-type sugar transport system permease subunit